MPNGKCQKCEAGTYLLNAPTQTQLCLPCPISGNAECLGGNEFYPMPGFWRSSAFSDNIMECRNHIACLYEFFVIITTFSGRDPPNNNSQGECGKGY